MKKINLKVTFCLLLAACCLLSSCSDYFDPKTDDMLQNSDYISSSTEMYTGFLGILTKVQAVGDKEILLTDTRGEMLEPTDNTNSQLIAIYNYEPNLTGNEYADPAGYYDVVIACNDYINKMLEYKTNYPDAVEDSVYKDLVSSAIRIKVWTYKTIAEIYGQAVWFDSSVTKVEQLTEDKYQLLTLQQTIDRCISLLENGYNGVAANRIISWYKWLDPDTPLADSKYRQWDYIVPPMNTLLAELYLWKGALADSADAKAYYQNSADLILTTLNEYINDESYRNTSKPYFMPNANTRSDYGGYYWENSARQPYQRECIAAIIYDYKNNQTNTLLHHFSNEYPNEYQLRPSEYGRSLFEDNALNPGGSLGDKRADVTYRQNNAEYYIAKYRKVGSTVRPNAYEDDVHIYMYRVMHLNLMLAEALNHLDRFVAAEALLNQGVSNAYDAVEAQEWDGFTKNWTLQTDWGTAKYSHDGVRGCMGLDSRPFYTSTYQAQQAGVDIYRYNDKSIIDEYATEMSCEGKSYPALVRMAVCYGDPSIVADRICPKYPAAKQSLIRSRIESASDSNLPGYFVPWKSLIANR